MAKVIAPPLIRRARENDEALLAAFVCDGTPWADEAQTFIREDALLCQLGTPRAGRYEHTLLVAEASEGEIIGVAAFRWGPIQLISGSVIRGLILVVAAVATEWQGAIIEGDGKLSHALVAETTRRAARGRRSRAEVFAVLDIRNESSKALVTKFDFQPLPFGAAGSHHDVYSVRLDTLLARCDELMPTG